MYFLKQISNGFSELYKYKIMHRDVKPANFFLDDNMNIVIGDFGFAKSGCDLASTKLGTPITMAPELLNSNGGNYTNKADLWSIGVCLYQMLYGKTPFEASTYNELQQKVKLNSGNKIKFLPNIEISQNMKNMVISLLQYNP